MDSYTSTSTKQMILSYYRFLIPMSYASQSLVLHQKLQWKLATISKASVANKDDLSLAYTPWVAEPCKVIAQDKKKARDLTLKWNTIAVISDGSAVLGLWNIWPEAALPVMEGKCVLLKEFAWVNAFPLVINTQDTEEIITFCKQVAPTFGGINLEDISAPRCFEIEERLKAELDIPVFHDDQHGTAIVVLAAIINALKIISKAKETVEVVINGVWAAGVAVAKLLLLWWVKDILLVDSKWIIYSGREHLNPTKTELADITNHDNVQWSLTEAIAWRDIFIGLSKPGLLTQAMVQSMNPDPVIFAMANPTPEIMPDEAKAAWARIVATWRSDFPNQINNVLAFPGIFKGALEAWVSNITDDMKIRAAVWLASLIAEPTEDHIIPSAFTPGVAEIVAESVKP